MIARRRTLLSAIGLTGTALLVTGCCNGGAAEEAMAADALGTDPVKLKGAGNC